MLLVAIIHRCTSPLASLTKPKENDHRSSPPVNRKGYLELLLLVAKQMIVFIFDDDDDDDDDVIPFTIPWDG
jgi:hypothetical protein